MKRILLLLLISAAAMTATEPRVGRSLLGAAEKGFDAKVVDLFRNTLVLVGPSRGVYLEGIGVVMTAEVDLSPPALTLFGGPTPQQIVEMHKQKIERLPQLKAAMKETLLDAAAKFSGLPATEKVIFSVLIPRYPGESAAGMPLQVIAQATKQQLLDAKRTGADTAIQFVEY